MQDREKIEHIFIDIRSKEHDLSYRFIKRLFDIVASISALLLLTPIFLIVIIAIKISSPSGCKLIKWSHDKGVNEKVIWDAVATSYKALFETDFDANWKTDFNPI
ncbi:hypothetical protein [Lactiplantibacillus plantarum]|uniref:hypothetical protein n=1 Tax=Lactiplantibacillus plantarum TaxID=1590 RepID=UPI003F53652B